MRAYFTVEAALILPVTLGIYVLLIYAMFFQYDRSLMEKNMAVLAIRGTLLPSDSNEEIMDFIRQQAAEIDKSKYIAFDQESVVDNIIDVIIFGDPRRAVTFSRAARAYKCIDLHIFSLRYCPRPSFSRCRGPARRGNFPRGLPDSDSRTSW